MSVDSTEPTRSQNKLRQVIEAQENARQETNWLIGTVLLYCLSLMTHYAVVTHIPHAPYTWIGPGVAFLVGMGAALVRLRDWVLVIALITVLTVIGNWLMGAAVGPLIAAYIIGFIICSATSH